jgi:chromatin remodeling complex protein RSC6
LSEVVGSKSLPRTEIIKKIWDYVKKNGLQDKVNRRMINADAKLRPIFGKDQISMFELAKVVNNKCEVNFFSLFPPIWFYRISFIE